MLFAGASARAASAFRRASSNVGACARSRAAAAPSPSSASSGVARRSSRAVSARSTRDSATASAQARVAPLARGAPSARHTSARNADATTREPSSVTMSAASRRAHASSLAAAAASATAGGAAVSAPDSAAARESIGAIELAMEGQYGAYSNDGWRSNTDARNRVADARTSFASREASVWLPSPANVAFPETFPSFPLARRSRASAADSHSADASARSSAVIATSASRYAPTCSPAALSRSCAARINPSGRLLPLRTRSRTRASRAASSQDAFARASPAPVAWTKADQE